MTAKKAGLGRGFAERVVGGEADGSPRRASPTVARCTVWSEMTRVGWRKGGGGWPVISLRPVALRAPGG
ncbi:MAG TPA: hypothetical protein VFU47_11550, partial [Armatimonadota bacterium]|nr:hypothetical protein [Armatimonadota bacterium]